MQGAERDQVRPNLRAVLGIVLRRRGLGKRAPAAAAQRMRCHLHAKAQLTAISKVLYRSHGHTPLLGTQPLRACILSWRTATQTQAPPAAAAAAPQQSA